MAEKNIGIKITLDGEKEFRAAMTSCKKESANFKSELNLISKEYKNSANSLEALTKKQQAYEKAVANQEKVVKELVSIQEKATSRLNDEKKALEEAKKQRENLKKSLEDAKKLYGENSEQVKKLATQLDASNSSITKQESEIAKLSNKITDWNTQENNARAELDKLNDELSQNEKYLKEAEKSTDRVAQSIDELGNEVKDSKQEISVFGDVLKANLTSTAIIAGVKALANGIREIATSAIDVGSQFEASMSQVAATMGMTADEIANGSESYKLLETAAQKCGESTMYSASQAAEALNYLALAGYDAEKAAATLPKVLDLAAAGGMDLAYASDLVTDSMAALGMETSELDNYIDQMAKTSQKSNTSIAQLGEATLVCAGTVTLAGQELTTMNAELGVLANNGLKGAEGGTHLRNMLLSLANPTDKADIALKKLGVDIANSDGSMRDLNDIMIDLNKSMAGMGTVEKTQMIAKIFNKTDISAVNALLKGTNGEFSNLVDQLNDCAGAAGNMADTMNDNLKGQVTILQSALEGLGIAAYDVFDDTMKSAVSGATSAVSRLTQEIKTGNLGVSLERMGKAMAEFTDRTVDAAEDALPGLIDGLTWTIEHLDEIGVALKAVGAGFLAYKGYSIAVSAVSAAMAIQQTVTEGATVAQMALNTAMELNPIGLLVAGVAALTVGLISWQNATEEQVNENTKLLKSSEELRESIEESSETRKADAEEMKAQGQVASQLADRLSELQKKTRLTADEELEQKAIIDQLNSIYPELGLAIDSTTGKLNQETEAIKRSVEAAFQKALVASYEEQLTDIVNQQVEAYKEKAKVESDLNDKLKEHGLTLEEYNQLLDTNTEYISSNNLQILESHGLYVDERAEIGLMIEEIGALDTSYNELSTEYENINAEIENHTQALAGAKDAANGLPTEYYLIGDAVYEVTGATQEQSLKLAELSEAYSEAQEEAQKSLESQIGLFEELSVTSDLSIGQMISNLESQTATLQTYGSDLDTVKDKVSGRAGGSSLLSALEELGIDGAGYVHELANASDEDMTKLLESFDKVSEAKETVSSTMADISTGFSDYLDDMSKSADDTGVTVVKSTSDSMNDMNTAVSDGAAQVVATASGMADDIVEELNVESDAYTQGANVAVGMANGINANADQAVMAATNMAQRVLDATAVTLDEHSPSKKTQQQGAYAAEGFAIGYEDESENIIDTVQQTMENVANANASAEYSDTSSNANIIDAIKGIGNGDTSGYLASILEVVQGLSGMQVVLDSGALVGSTAMQMNNALGRLSAREGRR